MLDYIYQFANDIDYCIFYSGMGSVEILQLTEIPKIKEFLSAYKIHIEPCPSIQMCRTIGYGVKS